MTNLLSIKMIDRQKLIPFLLVFGYTILVVLSLNQYLHFSANFILGTLALVITWKTGSRQTPRFALAGLLFTILYSGTPAKTLLFAAIACALLFVAETFAGHISALSVFTLLIMSPIFEYLSNIFSFPIRIKLTDLAAMLMKAAGDDLHARGNTLISDRLEFSVDPACMGLHMFATSLLAGLILIGIFQKKQKKQLSVVKIAALLTIIVFLNVIGNLIRIVCLVHFRIGPDDVTHETIGLICFACYVLIPASFMIRKTIDRSSSGEPASTFCERTVSTRILWTHALLLVAISVIAIAKKDLTGSVAISSEPIFLPGYSSTMVADHVTKLENGRSLIYIKPIAGFYSSDHQPTMCWSGSGYEFKKVEERRIGELDTYVAQLEKDKDVLYTAWWYDDGNQTTNSQLEWRWHAFSQGNQYALINVTASTPTQLENEIQAIRQLQIRHKKEKI